MQAAALPPPWAKVWTGGDGGKTGPARARRQASTECAQEQGERAFRPEDQVGVRKEWAKFVVETGWPGNGKP